MLWVKGSWGQICRNTLGKLILEFVIASCKGLVGQLRSPLLEIVIALAQSLLRRNGQTLWKLSAKGINQSCLLLKFVLADGSKVHTVGILKLTSRKRGRLGEVAWNKIGRDETGNRDTVIAV